MGRRRETDKKILGLMMSVMMVLVVGMAAMPGTMAQEELEDLVFETCEIAETVTANSIYIPAGVTVTALNDLVLNAVEEIIVDGNLVGLNGAGFTLISGKNLTVNGNVIAGDGSDGAGQLFQGGEGTNGGSMTLTSREGIINIGPDAMVASGTGGKGGNALAYGIGDYNNSIIFESVGGKAGDAGNLELYAGAVNLDGILSVGNGGAGGDAIALGRGFELVSAVGGPAGRSGALAISDLDNDALLTYFEAGQIVGGNGGAGGSALAIGEDLPTIVADDELSATLNRFIGKSGGSGGLETPAFLAALIAGLLGSDTDINDIIAPYIQEPPSVPPYGALIIKLVMDYIENPPSVPPYGALIIKLVEETLEDPPSVPPYGAVIIKLVQDTAEDAEETVWETYATAMALVVWLMGQEIPDLNDILDNNPNDPTPEPQSGEDKYAEGEAGVSGDAGDNGDDGWWMGSEGEDGGDGADAVSAGQPANAIGGDGKDGGSGGHATAIGGDGGSGGGGGNGGNGADGWAWVEGGNGGTGGDGGDGKKGGSASAKGGDASIGLRLNTVAFYSKKGSNTNADLPIAKGGNAYAYGGAGGNGGDGGDGGDGGAAGCWSNPGIGGTPSPGSEIVGVGGTATATPGLGIISGTPVAEPGLPGAPGTPGKPGNDGQPSTAAVSTVLDGSLANELKNKGA
ncbi:MAG: hypothetical protein CVT48_05905 [Thermoplasmata archaeon HGW-Thermoplasmata-1]|nr:MAG: hypothetical protein CVT48_05905 [Thermoplasmata archaeon HGW-Thermoplasmata-1]